MGFTTNPLQPNFELQHKRGAEKNFSYLQSQAGGWRFKTSTPVRDKSRHEERLADKQRQKV